LPTWAWVCLLLTNILSNIMWAHLCSCAGPRENTWLLACPTTPAFRLFLAHFFTTPCTHLGLSHPTVAHLSRC
jgi:hypothetical protein